MIWVMEKEWMGLRLVSTLGLRRARGGLGQTYLVTGLRSWSHRSNLTPFLPFPSFRGDHRRFLQKSKPTLSESGAIHDLEGF